MRLLRVGCELLDLNRCPVRSWKNGAGVMRELAVHPRDASGDDFDWRISVAQVVGDSPFSQFPGVDRCIALLQGAGLRLRWGASTASRLIDRVNVPFHFPGEESISAELIDGPCQNMSILAKRDRHSVHCLSIAREYRLAMGGAVLIYCGLAGGLVEPGRGAPRIHLGRQQAVLWRDNAPALRIVPNSADAPLLAVGLGRATDLRRAS